MGCQEHRIQNKFPTFGKTTNCLIPMNPAVVAMEAPQTPPPSPEHSINSREALTENDLHNIFCDCRPALAATRAELDATRAEVVAHRLEVEEMRSRVGPDIIVGRVEFIGMQREVRANRIKIQALGMVVVSMAIVMSGMLVVLAIK